ncbi:hypothetical protein [Gorillibacterium massiliense]|uniref:hypothetical protein n=1 Tax=Gorillibacterium massiliense TaxID=1280390 RepID=UPI0004B396C1|nr:hypothetical protein [Gorillibacterium massiliense]
MAKHLKIGLGSAIIGFLALAIVIIRGAMASKEDSGYVWDGVWLPVPIDVCMSFEPTIKEFTKRADHIVIGTVKETGTYDNSSPLYLVSVKKEVKGQLDEPLIHVTSNDPLHKGETYFLFLESSESPFIDYVNYRVTNLSWVNPVKDGVFLSGPFKDIRVNRLAKDIQSLPEAKFKNERTKVIDHVDSVQEMIGISDAVIMIKPLDYSMDNGVIRLFTFKILEKFKDDQRLLNAQSIILANTVEPGKKYLLFLKLLGDPDAVPSLQLAARHGSVIAEEDQANWEKVLGKLNAQK